MRLGLGSRAILVGFCDELVFTAGGTVDGLGWVGNDDILLRGQYAAQ